MICLGQVCISSHHQSHRLYALFLAQFNSWPRNILGAWRRVGLNLHSVFLVFYNVLSFFKGRLYVLLSALLFDDDGSYVVAVQVA